jgi:hypothetical protein
MTRAIRASAIALTIALASCSTARRPVVTPSTTGPRSTTTTLAPLSLADASVRYQAADSALETALAGPRSRLTVDASNFAATKVDYAKIADAYRSFDQALRAIKFPQPAAGHVRELLNADATLELYVQAAADAASPASLASDESSILSIAQPQLGYRNVVRQTLNLAPIKA